MKKILNITVERAKRGMTIRELADRIGVSGTYVSYLETGQRTASKERREQLSEVFEVDAITLFNEVSI